MAQIFEFDDIDTDELEDAVSAIDKLEEIFGEPCVDEDFAFAINLELAHRVGSDIKEKE